MNLNEDFFSEQPKSSNEIMGMAMQEIHDILLAPMKDKLTPEQDGVLAIVGLTLKIMAEKATALEQMEQGKLTDSKENEFYRN